MGTATACPSKALGLCQIPCGKKYYAERAEIQYYKHVLPYRQRQGELWQKTTPFIFAQAILAINKRARYKIKYLRFNESGDITNYEDLVKVNHIAEILKPYGIRVYIYTARRIYFGEWSENLTFNGSGFMLDNNYKVLPEREIDKSKFACYGSCGTCKACILGKGITIQSKLRR